MTTRDQVHGEFGQPVASGEADGKPFEEFRTRRKIAEQNKLSYLIIYDVMTAGLMELYFVPHELAVYGKRVLLGQTLRFTYDENGNVTEVRHDSDLGIGVPRPGNGK